MLFDACAVPAAVSQGPPHRLPAAVPQGLPHRVPVITSLHYIITLWFVAHQAAEREGNKQHQLGMDEAADGLPAAYRQELMMEERQLLATLRRRYAGFAPLEAELDQLDAELEALEAIPTTPVASPPPRGSAARPQ